MPMDVLIRDDLAQQTPSDFHQQLLVKCKKLIFVSRSQMSKYYDRWDQNDMAYRGERKKDQQDKRLEEQGDTVKLAVPLTYAQVHTFVAFCFSVYFQRSAFYEMVGTGPEDQITAKVAEATLQRDLVYNKWATRCYQFLLDIGRFGLGILEVGWIKELQVVWKETTISSPGFALGSFQLIKPKQTNEVTKTFGTKFLGNRLYNVSPYRFYPDVRVPISRFQEGEFCGSDDEVTYARLKELERDGEVVGVDYISSLREDDFLSRNLVRLADVQFDTQMRDASIRTGSILLTKCQLKLIPKHFTVSGKPIGEEDYPVKYNVWYANNNRIIKCEPSGYTHDEFTYCVTQISPDQHRLINESICDLCGPLQDVTNWFLNSHIKSVRNVIQNYLVVDPAAIDINDIKMRRPVLKLLPGASRQGVDKWIKQLNVQDVTANHMADIDVLQSLMQIITGVSENAMGQFHGGRRSASEARAVNAGTANRLQMLAKIIWTDALDPLGRQMIANQRDGLDEPTFVRLTGDIPDLNAFNRFKQVDKNMLVGNYDFEIFDGTLPSEKNAIANSLEELFAAFIQNPQAAMALGIDTQKLLMLLAKYRGIPAPEQVLIDPARMRLAQAGLASPPGADGNPQPQQGMSMMPPQGVQNGQSIPVAGSPQQGQGASGVGDLLNQLVSKGAA